MTTAIRGIDISSWQHPGGAPIDWEKVAAIGLRFVLVKASQGTGYINPWAVRDLEDARAEGLLVGAYHYFGAGENVEAQAQCFLQATAGQSLDLGAWLDWECYAPAPYTHDQELAAFLTAIKDTRGACGVYCDLSWAEQLKADALKVDRLWLANPSATPNDFAPLVVQGTPIVVEGITGEVDSNVLANVRGVNLLSAPKPKPTADQTAALALLAKASQDTEAAGVEEKDAGAEVAQAEAEVSAIA